MKVYVTDEKELIMEPSLKWAANPNVMVAVKAFGLKATAQVLDLVLLYCEISRAGSLHSLSRCSMLTFLN